MHPSFTSIWYFRVRRSLTVNWTYGPFSRCYCTACAGLPSEAEGCVYHGTNVRCLRFRPGQRSGAVLSETGSEHLHVIADEVSRVAELCIGKDMGTMSTATAFTEMEAGSVNRL